MYLSNLFGLKRISKVNLSFDLINNKIIEANGCDLNNDRIEISVEKVFGLPIYISVNGFKYFPSKYEILSDGYVIYSSLNSPALFGNFNSCNPFDFRLKKIRKTITLQDLNEYDIKKRRRKPTQLSIMKESAKIHAQKNIFLLDLPNRNIKWHWCHLISYAMMHNDKAQVIGNLVCATNICNGHMSNIESAVKKFIYEYKRPLKLEINVEVFNNTHLAKKIKYSVFDMKKSLMTFTEYFDAITITKSDVLDMETIYSRMQKEFNETSNSSQLSLILKLSKVKNKKGIVNNKGIKPNNFTFVERSQNVSKVGK